MVKLLQRPLVSVMSKPKPSLSARINDYLDQSFFNAAVSIIGVSATICDVYKRE